MPELGFDLDVKIVRTSPISNTEPDVIVHVHASKDTVLDCDESLIDRDVITNKFLQYAIFEGLSNDEDDKLQIGDELWIDHQLVSLITYEQIEDVLDLMIQSKAIEDTSEYETTWNCPVAYNG